MCNLIESRNNYSKTPESLYQFCRDEPEHSITDSESFKLKSIFLNNTNNPCTINVEIAVSLKYLKVIFGKLLKSI